MCIVENTKSRCINDLFTTCKIGHICVLVGLLKVAIVAYCTDLPVLLQHVLK